MRIEELKLSPKVERSLARAGFKTVEELRATAPLKLAEIRGLGKASIREIHNRLVLAGRCEVCANRQTLRVVCFDALEPVGTFAASYCPKCGHKVSD